MVWRLQRVAAMDIRDLLKIHFALEKMVWKRNILSLKEMRTGVLFEQ